MQTISGLIAQATNVVIMAGIAYWAYQMFFSKDAPTKDKGIGGLMNVSTGILAIALVVAAVANIAAANSIGNALLSLLLSILTGA